MTDQTEKPKQGKKIPTVTFEYAFINEVGDDDIRELTMKSARLMPNKIAGLPFSDVTDAAMRWAMTAEDFRWWQDIPSGANDYGKTLVDAWQEASKISLGESKAS